MSRISFDRKKCMQCLRCISVCPFTVLHEKNGRPEVTPGKACILCAHCAAACPADAVLLDGTSGVLAEDLPAFPGEFPQNLGNFLKIRRSYRHFKPVPVEEETLEGALQAAAWAPSAKNQHPARWYAVHGEEKIQEIMGHILAYVKETGVNPEIVVEYENGNNVVTGTARTLLLVFAEEASLNPAVDTALALYTAELFLQSRGVGTCWAGYLTRMCNQVPALQRLFALPDGHRFYGALMAGYPENETYLHIPRRLNMPEVRTL